MELLEGNRVLEHTLMRNKVLDGDNHVLHVQVRPMLAGWPHSSMPYLTCIGLWCLLAC
jgi:hypothetical protein